MAKSVFHDVVESLKSFAMFCITTTVAYIIWDELDNLKTTHNIEGTFLSWIFS